MNNKGQSLVLFVLIIPILVGIMALVIDVGKVFITKSSQENTIELILEYHLEDLKNNTLEEDKIKTLVEKNLTKNESNIKIEEESITISTEEEVEGIFSKLLGFNKFQVKTELIGYLENDTLKINKLK